STRDSEVASPAANTTVVAPSSTATTVAAARAGRADGVPRPKLTGRGSRVAASARRTRKPRPLRGARPTVIACTADSRPARAAAAAGAGPTTAGTPSSTTRWAQAGIVARPEREYARAVSASSGVASGRAGGQVGGGAGG